MRQTSAEKREARERRDVRRREGLTWDQFYARCAVDAVCAGLAAMARAIEAAERRTA